MFKDTKSDETVRISAKEHRGFKELLEQIETMLNAGFVRIEKTFSYEEAGKIQIIRQFGKLEKEEYTEAGIFVSAAVPAEYVGQVM